MRNMKFKFDVEFLEPRLVRSSFATLSADPHGGHGGNEVLSAEHATVMALVDPANATDVVFRDGLWSDTGTWSSGQIPATGADILIPEGKTVVVDSTYNTQIDTIRVDGSLVFSTEVNTGLLVETIVVSTTGSFVMGTQEDPIPIGVTSTVTFADTGPIDQMWDPFAFSRGLISHGEVSIHGAEVTPHSKLTQPPRRGDTVLHLSTSPVNWRAGDLLVLAGTSPLADQDELLHVVSVSGKAVTVDRPLEFNHLPPEAGLSTNVANLDRNAVFRSENAADITRHGHVMFMHSDEVEVVGAGFYDLGRSDKRKVVDEAKIDETGAFVEGTGTNPRGRYAVHVHRTGSDHDAVLIRDSVVTNSPGWGFANHSSNADFIDNVSYDVLGAGFASEAGDETGRWLGNLAVRSRGRGISGNDTVDGRFSKSDFGYEGHGFWLQGNGIEVINNVAAGHPGFGFVFYSFGIRESGSVVRFKTSNLPNPNLFGNRETVPVDWVPLFKVEGIESFANSRGFLAWRFNQENPNPLPSEVSRLTTWNTKGTGLDFGYQRRGVYKDSTILGNGAGVGIQAAATYGRDAIFSNLRVENWSVGMVVPKTDSTTITGGTFHNEVDFDLTRIGVSTPRTVSISAGVGSNFFLGNGVPPVQAQSAGPGVYLTKETILIGDKQLYRKEQLADFVLFASESAADWVPEDLIGKTNLEMQLQYGRSTNDAVAPADAVPFGDGFLGSPAVYGDAVTLISRRFVNQLDGYMLSFRAGSTIVVDSNPTQLVQGWNLLTRQVNGAPRTVLVYGDIVPTTFTPISKLVVSRSKLSDRFSIFGIADDDVTGKSRRVFSFTGLEELPKLTKPSGQKYVEVCVTLRDFTGNVATQKIQIDILEDA